MTQMETPDKPKPGTLDTMLFELEGVRQYLIRDSVTAAPDVLGRAIKALNDIRLRGGMPEIGLDTSYPKDRKNDPDHVITFVKLLNAQVCSRGTWDEALDFIQRASPAGTSNNWQKDERPEVAPVACLDMPGRTHYIFTC